MTVRQRTLMVETERNSGGCAWGGSESERESISWEGKEKVCQNKNCKRERILWKVAGNKPSRLITANSWTLMSGSALRRYFFAAYLAKVQWWEPASTNRAKGSTFYLEEPKNRLACRNSVVEKSDTKNIDARRSSCFFP